MPQHQPKKTVSARFDADALKLIDRARKPFEDSRGDHVRRVVVAAVNRTEEAMWVRQIRDLQNSTSDLQVEIQKTQRAMRRLTFAILVTRASMSDEEAHDVAANLFKEGP